MRVFGKVCVGGRVPNNRCLAELVPPTPKALSRCVRVTPSCPDMHTNPNASSKRQCKARPTRWCQMVAHGMVVPRGRFPCLHFFSSTPPAPSIVIVTNLFPGRMRFTLPTSSVVLARTPGLGRVCPLKIAASRANPLVSTDLTRRKMYAQNTDQTPMHI